MSHGRFENMTPCRPRSSGYPISGVHECREQFLFYCKERTAQRCATFNVLRKARHPNVTMRDLLSSTGFRAVGLTFRHVSGLNYRLQRNCLVC